MNLIVGIFKGVLVQLPHHQILDALRGYVSVHLLSAPRYDRSSVVNISIFPDKHLPIQLI